jgi:hypothetical protein
MRICRCPLAILQVGEEFLQQLRLVLHARDRSVALYLNRSISLELDLPAPARERDLDHHRVWPRVAKPIRGTRLIETVEEGQEASNDIHPSMRQQIGDYLAGTYPPLS